MHHNLAINKFSKIGYPKEFGLTNLAELISYGASPRATINLAIGAKAMAFIKRRGYVIPEDACNLSGCIATSPCSYL